ncbi:MAG: hypothetical protein RL095_2130 [Verrucomicrobiota bacterium]|jgi:hypothetical protein
MNLKEFVTSKGITPEQEKLLRFIYEDRFNAADYNDAHKRVKDRLSELLQVKPVSAADQKARS